MVVNGCWNDLVQKLIKLWLSKLEIWKILKYNYEYQRGPSIDMRSFEQSDWKIKSQVFMNLWYGRICMLVSHAYTKTLPVSLMARDTDICKISQESCEMYLLLEIF